MDGNQKYLWFWKQDFEDEANPNNALYSNTTKSNDEIKRIDNEK